MPANLQPRLLAALVVPLFLSVGCQDYSFDFRANERIEAQRVNQLVATLTPVDILFVIDNSGTMGEETAELKNNVEAFVTKLAAEGVNFNLGIVTPDVECNVPDRKCDGTAGSASTSCCALKSGIPVCEDKDNNGDGVVETSDCEAGRLQGSAANGRRVFTPPAAADRAQWVTEFVQAIDFALHGLKGSSFESGLQAAGLAVACATGSADCTDEATGNAKAARELNAGFIRPEADLVLIFLTDEDDCSATSRSVYLRPNSPGNATDQAEHFCGPNECYAYYNEGSDLNGDGLDDWSDPTVSPTPADRRFRCGGSARAVNPPVLAGVGTLLDKIVSYKGSLRQVRAAGIISAVQRSANVAYEGSACFVADGGPSAVCGCLTNADGFACEVTAANGQANIAIPNRGTPQSSGCTTAPSNRYVEFLNDLGSRRAASGLNRDVLVDSICRTRYDATLDTIVNNVIIPRCFQLPATPAGPEFLTVTLNGNTLRNVPVGSNAQGWSLVENSSQICLEGGLRKQVGDRFEILQVTAVPQP